jgi:hypothetical protein
MHKPIHLKKCGGALCQQRFKITQSGAPSTSGLGMKHLHAAPKERIRAHRRVTLKFLYYGLNRLCRNSKRIAELQFGSFLVYH